MSRLDYCQYELVNDCYDWKNDNCDGCNIFKAYCEGERRAKNSIVRCKDCRHRDLFSCPLADNDFQKDEDFCSWGERREPSAEQTEYKLPFEDEIMKKLDKLTLKGGGDNDGER